MLPTLNTLWLIADALDLSMSKILKEVEKHLVK